MGDAVCLRCHIGGTPDITVSWFKSDGKQRETSNCKMDYSNGIATLKISKATKVEDGEYTCKAENRIGTSSSRCRLVVKGDARFSFFWKL